MGLSAAALIWQRLGMKALRPPAETVEAFRLEFSQILSITK